MSAHKRKKDRWKKEEENRKAQKPNCDEMFKKKIHAQKDS